MKSLFLSFTALLALTFILTFSSCEKTSGDGNIITKELDTDIFYGVEMASAENVTITRGNEHKVIATGDYNIINKIQYSVINSGLKLDLEPGNYSDYTLSYQITAPYISNVKISGSGNVEIKGFEDQHSFFSSVSGSGNIKVINFYGTGNFKSDITGSGNISVYQDHQSFERVIVTSTGSGNFYGYNFRSDSTQVSTSGSGNIEIYVLRDLYAYISGAGNIYYKGAPSIKFQDHGSGKLIDAN